MLGRVLAICLMCMPLVAQGAFALGNCPGQPHGKCPVKKPFKPHHRADDTNAQREKLMEESRRTCQRKYPGSKLVRIDYYTWTAICGY